MSLIAIVDLVLVLTNDQRNDLISIQHSVMRDVNSNISDILKWIIFFHQVPLFFGGCLHLLYNDDDGGGGGDHN